MAYYPIAATPSVTDFQVWAAATMGLTTTVIPSNDPGYSFAFQVAQDLVPYDLMAIPDIYTLCVYNYAGSLLLQNQQDQAGQTFFANARTAYGINSFVAGVINGSNDVSTGQTLSVGKGLQNLDLNSLQLLKDPYGRQALTYMQMIGTLWGLS